VICVEQMTVLAIVCVWPDAKHTNTAIGAEFEANLSDCTTFVTDKHEWNPRAE
jgi:hypothetical protein